MKVLYYDCFAGISGDMNLGAMIDLGVPADYLAAALATVAGGAFELKIGREERRGVCGTRVEVVTHGNNEGIRRIGDIEALLGSADLPDAVKCRSLDIFMRIARAEASVHGIGLDAVHFHEVGAVDSIVDIVGAAVCHEYLGAPVILSSPIELGGGFITCAHGTLPAPAPATLEILSGVPVRMGLVPFEATTPTGAAILASTVQEFTEQVSFSLMKTGYGIGSRNAAIPNVLRVMLGAMPAEHASDVERTGALVIECTIDDMNPELYEHLMEQCFEAGAQDVFLTPVIMKKSRPAIVVSVLCGHAEADAVKHILLLHTSTFGLRVCTTEKIMLRREYATVGTPYGDITVKTAYFEGKKIKSKPEYEDCKRFAARHGIPITEIYRALRKTEEEQ